MRFILRTMAAIAAIGTAQVAAQAHYVWATITNRQARFALLENVNEAPNTAFEEYVTDLSPRSDGKTLPDGVVRAGARYIDLPAGRNLVFAQSIVGVKDRDGETYLLVYHAKGAANLASAQTLTKAPAELLVRREGQKLVVAVRQNGWPVPRSAVWVQYPGDAMATSIPTDTMGEAELPARTDAAPRDGFVGIRALVNEAKAGEWENKRYPTVHRWATLTFPVEAVKPVDGAKEDKPFTQILRASFGKNHEVVSEAAFNQTLFAGKLTKEQLIIHLQQRALIHNELHRILIAADPALHIPYGAAQKNVLVLLFNDLITLGSGWPTEPQARPLTQSFLQQIRESEKKGPFFALGVQHVYFGGITNGGRMIGEKIGETLKFTPSYYEKSDGYPEYLMEVNKITDPAARQEMIRGGQAAYQYIIASSNETVFK